METGSNGVTGRRLEQTQSVRELMCSVDCDDCDRQLESSATESFPARDEHEDEDEAVSGGERGGMNVSTRSRHVDTAGREHTTSPDVCRCNDEECLTLSVASSEADDDLTRTTVSAVSTSLHGQARPHLDNSPSNLPFIEAFNGVISRRALLKVCVILIRAKVDLTEHINGH